MPRPVPHRTLVARLRLSNGETVEVDFARSPRRWAGDLADAILAARGVTDASSDQPRTREDALGEEIRFLLATASQDVKDLLLAHLLASTVERRLKRRRARQALEPGQGRE